MFHRGEKQSFGLGYVSSVIFLTVFFSILFITTGWAANLEMASSWNPVGSGARALGMGGAFIAVADDATAASWNPGGLIQLEKPEVSIVGAYYKRSEDSTFGTNPEGNTKETVSDTDLNYFSVAFPFSLANRNMVVSINHQNLYDFNRELNTYLDESGGGFTQQRTINENHDGNVTALGLAYAIRLVESFTLGLTLNVWDNWLGDNGWETDYYQDMYTEIVGLPGSANNTTTRRITEYSFEGYNANIGFMWNVTPKLTIGAVLKTPFTADVHKDITTTTTGTASPGTTTSQDDMEIDMPMSYGIGAAFRASDALTVAFDIYRTEWDNFTQTDSNGVETSPITDESLAASNIDATIQARLGMEYLIIKPKMIIPVRGGLFYDPAPAVDHPDDFYGFSLGSGVIFEKFVIDIAYQYRFGDNVGRSVHQVFDFSQDVEEHKVYTSAIVYF